jgi:hypothetical protein
MPRMKNVEVGQRSSLQPFTLDERLPNRPLLLTFFERDTGFEPA